MAEDAKLRALVLLYVVVKYMDQDTRFWNPAIDKGREGMPPVQSRLCNRKVGADEESLLEWFYETYGLTNAGYVYPCSGPPHIHQAATLLGELGWFKERGKKNSRQDYEPTEKGRNIVSELDNMFFEVRAAKGKHIYVDPDRWIDFISSYMEIG